MPSRSTAVLALAAALAAPAVTGCADLARVSRLAPAAVDPASPVAGRVQAAAARSYPYPRFQDVPPRPTDVRPPDRFKTAVIEMIGDRRALKGWTATNPAMSNGTEGFAAETRAQIPAEVLKPLDSTTTESMEAYAARLRREGAAPPPLPRGPAPTPVPRP